METTNSSLLLTISQLFLTFFINAFYVTSFADYYNKISLLISNFYYIKSFLKNKIVQIILGKNVLFSI